MSARPIQLQHANIRVRNLERSEKFYSEVLGLTVMNRLENPKISFLAACEAHSHELALVEIGDEAPGPDRKAVGTNHFAWQMGSFDDLKEIHRRLQEHNTEIVRISDHNISMGIYFRDPDGNENEVYYELPKSQWPKPVGDNIFQGENPFQWSLEDDSPSDAPRRTVAVT